MTDLGAERPYVQQPIIDYVCEESAEYRTPDGRKIICELGWQYVGSEEAVRLRGGETGLVFRELFVSQLQRLNPAFMNEALAQEITKKLERIPPTIEGNLQAWEYLKGLKTVFVPKEKRERNVRFIDSENLANNTFHVTDEFRFSNGTQSIKGDLVFLVNGLPVFIIETKASHKLEGMAEALDQMRRYHREGPELMALMQVYAITHILRFYYGATWSLSGKDLLNWKEESKGDFETIVKSFLDRRRVVDVLTRFILFTRKDDELRKVVLRPHQMRAVQRVVERAADARKRRGLIWHTQGSGKTYTMIVAAQQIIASPLFNDPTVLMLVDRTELETQLSGNLDSLGVQTVEVTRNKDHLLRLLRQDKRGLIVSMIHKFEDMPANVNTRENIFVLVDEAHRTTGGKLGNLLMGALPNATYIGFTGTPIDRTSYGKGTFITFGQEDPPAGYLDKYSIVESIEDGTTVRLDYTIAPNDLRVDRQTLEREFLNLAEAQGISDIEELNRVLDRAVNLKNMLKNKERVAKVADYVARHFKEHIEPMGYKAFLVAVDREACALYKAELDKHLPPEYSQVVFSPGFNDQPELAQYHLSEDEEKRVRKAFCKPDQLPKILIVTEKLLTGFDAPILYCMYLDKPMRDHVLLQAIARVNRPYEDDTGRKKPSGFVLDFVGIFEKLEKALAFDSADVTGALHDIAVLKERFGGMMREAKADYLSLVKQGGRDKAVEALLNHFMDEEKRHGFYAFFRELSDIYEILSPDAFLRPYVEDYETLARMYRILREAFEPGAIVDREFFRKTAKLVQERTKSGDIRDALEIYEINEETLRKIQKSKASDTEKVFNLLKSVLKTVTENTDREPYLISIGERAEQIAENYKQRQKDTIDTLNELRKLVLEINAARRQQAEKHMPAEVFSIFWVLKHEGVAMPEDIANAMTEVLQANPHWRTSEQHERRIKQALYQNLLKAGIEETAKLTEISNKIMRILTGGGK